MFRFRPAVVISALLLFLITACGVNTPQDELDAYPSRVIDYRQAPGQFYSSSVYSIESNLDKLLGPPSGGGIFAADNSSVVSLGMAGGYVVLEFDPPITNNSSGSGGYDFIVYGNSFWSGGDPRSPIREPGVIQVMKDENGNGEPDDVWYLIPGSHLSAGDKPLDIEYSVVWNEDGGGTVSWSAGEDSLYHGSAAFSSSQPWWSEESGNSAVFESVWLLPDDCYDTILDFSSVWGYADSAPTQIPGDLDGNGYEEDSADNPDIDPALFYSVPDTHGDNQIDPGSGGGSSIDLDWAVTENFEPVQLEEVSWIKISSASLSVDSVVGEYSCEVDAVVRVTVR